MKREPPAPIGTGLVPWDHERGISYETNRICISGRCHGTEPGCLWWCFQHGCSSTASSAAAASAAASAAAADSDLDYIKAKGKMVIGYTVYEPMNYTDADGNFTGL